MRHGLLPLTYLECRERFRHGAWLAGWAHEAHRLAAVGPHGEHLTIDIAAIGPANPDRALVVMSGVHGVEGFIGSAMQVDLIDQLNPADLPADLAILAIHAVNPWGMAWWRRQNESNVDLNRNWNRNGIQPPLNPGYAQVHPLLCPASASLPTPESFLDPIAELVEAHGIGWVRAAVSAGQYTHPDGMYFGGHRTEASTEILAEVVRRRLTGASTTLSVDLHTGHGAWAAPTILSDQPEDSPAGAWLHRHFDPEIIETTVTTGDQANPSATTAHKVGQLGHGFAEVLPGTAHHSFTLEIGTVRNTRMILAERVEHWIHLHGDRNEPGQAALIWDHRTLSSPEDADWVAIARAHGRSVLTRAVASIAG